MSAIYLLLSLIILLVNLNALALVGRRLTGDWLLGLNVALLGLCLPLYFIEHQWGLGDLSWLWPITTLASLYLIQRQKDIVWQTLRQQAVFVALLLFTLLWRWRFADIDHQSEALTDLYFMANFFSGQTLPAADLWLAGYQFDFYYGFQHYAGALLGRIMGWSLGMSYNFSLALIIALIGSLVVSIAQAVKTPAWLIPLPVLAIIVGGSGASLVNWLQFAEHSADGNLLQRDMWSSVRFIGAYAQQGETAFAVWLQAMIKQHPQLGLQLPLETIGYLTYQGDYHPPLGGFWLLLLALAAMMHAQVQQQPKQQLLLQGVITASVPVALIINTWVFPLQVLLVVCWTLWHWWHGKLHIGAWLAGGCIAALCAMPAISLLASNAVSTPLQWVPETARAPWITIALQWWPQALLLLLALYHVRRQPLLIFVIMVSVSGYLLSELIYVDDPYGGEFERFNTALKWWSWLAVFMIAGLAPILLASKQRWLQLLAALPLLGLLSYSIPMAQYFVYSPPAGQGQLSGEQWLQHADPNKRMLQYLSTAPRGVVLEPMEHMAYSPTSAIAVFALQPSFVGWASHQSQWRSNPEFINQRFFMTQQFYRGELANSRDWLNNAGIRYVLWPSQRNLTYENWLKVNQQISDDYQWLGFDLAVPGSGLWVRKDASHE